jgi:hypothetical protein
MLQIVTDDGGRTRRSIAVFQDGGAGAREVRGVPTEIRLGFDRIDGLHAGADIRHDDQRPWFDVAFDRLGHLYVLDRTAVFVFSPQRKLLTTFSIPEKSPGAFTNGEALALDSAARLFVFDGRTNAVQVYR